jgi:hypothetical protein
MFLQKANVVKKISEVRESPHPDVLSSLFSDAIITMGLNSLRNPIDERRASSIVDPEQIRSLLDRLVDFCAVPNSLLKLQVREMHLYINPRTPCRKIYIQNRLTYPASPRVQFADSRSTCTYRPASRDIGNVRYRPVENLTNLMTRASSLRILTIPGCPRYCL